MILSKIAEIKPKYVDENGVERDIDTTVVESQKEGYAYENTTNSLKAYFKESIAGYDPVVVQTDKGAVSWQLFGMSYRDELGNEEWLERVRENAIIEVVDNVVTYRNSLTMIDDEFVVEPGMLKHNTIIHSLPPYSGSLPGEKIFLAFEGRLDFSEHLKIYVDGEEKTTSFRTSSRIELRDEEGNIHFYLPEPNAYELKNEEKETQCYYEVIVGDHFITFLIETPLEWLSQAQYPVVVDPTLGRPSSVPFEVSKFGFNPKYNYIVAVANVDGMHKIVTFKYTEKSMEVVHISDKTISTEIDYLCYVTFHPEGRYVAISYASDPPDMYRFDPSTGAIGEKVLPPDGVGWRGGIGFHPDGKTVVAGTTGKFDVVILEFDPTKGEFKKDYALARVSGLSYRSFLSPCGNYIVSADVGSSAQNLYLYSFNAETKEVRYVDYARNIFSTSSNQFSRVAFWYDGDIIYIAPIARTAFYNSLFNSAVRYAPGTGISVLRIGFSLLGPITKDGYALQTTTAIRFPDTSTRKNHYIQGLEPYELSPDDRLIAYPSSESFVLCRLVRSEGITFLDPTKPSVYESMSILAIEGEPVYPLDMGVVTEGQYSDIYEVRVENHKELAIEDLTIQVEGNTNGDLIEFSKTKEPFVSEPMLHFPETLEVGEGVTFYIRVKPHPDNTSPLRKIPISARAVYAL